MRVAVCFEFAAVNGGENSFLTLVPELHKRGIELTAVAPESGPLARRLQAFDIPLIPWRSGTSDERLPDLDQRRHALSKALHASQPDVVHGNSLNMSRLLGPVVAEQGLASIGHLRDIMKLSARAIRDVAQHPQLLAVSAATRRFHVAQGLPNDQVHVRYNGIDLAQFRPRGRSGYLHRELGIDDAAQLVGGIGQIGLRKGWDTGLQAFAQVAAQFPQLHFLIVGHQHSRKLESNEFAAQLRAKASSKATQGRVHFLGRRDDVPRLLSELTALIHPARQEPLGRVLLEAAASQLPVIATDVGGTREIFPATSQAALLVQPDAPAELANAMRTLLSNDQLQAALGFAARREMEQRFRLEPCAEALANDYATAFAMTTPR